MRLSFVVMLLAFGFLIQCRDLTPTSKPNADFDLGELVQFGHDIREQFANALEGQGICMVGLNSPPFGPHFLLHTPERLISWVSLLEKGCTQAVNQATIPDGFKLLFLKGTVYEQDAADRMHLPIGATGIEAFTDLVADVGGKRATVGVISQKRIMRGSAITDIERPTLLSLCQFGAFRRDAFAKVCKLEATNPYKHTGQRSLKLILL